PAGPVGEDPRPGDREPVRVRVEPPHQGDVLDVAVVVVVGDVPVVVVPHVAGRVGVRVPDRGALAVLVPGSLDLVGGRGDPPREPVGEPAVGAHGGPRCPLLPVI